jgi:23S rRNA (adenine2503-C2)-methyltransferase
MQKLLGLNTEELGAVAVELGEKAFRGKQMADWLYRKGIRQIDEMSTLPAAFKSALAAQYTVGRSTIAKVSKSRDRTFKLLLKAADGELIETVGMHYTDRFSCCVSTQVGCAVNCLFCATGAGGFKRNLSAAEIVDQVLAVREYAVNQRIMGEEGRVSHVVFMGMGEPLVNYDATLKAVHLLNSELNTGMRNLTISTIGYVPGIYKLAGEHLQLTLAISLHTADDDLRRKLVPGMSRYSLPEIIGAARAFIKETGRRVTFEYCLLKEVNDRKDDAIRLAALLKGLNCHVNLIPYNPVSGSGFKPPEAARVADFFKILEASHIQVTQREQRGVGIDAACGQLRRREI